MATRFQNKGCYCHVHRCVDKQGRRRPAYQKGLCTMHYFRWRRGTRLDRLKPGELPNAKRKLSDDQVRDLRSQAWALKKQGESLFGFISFWAKRHDITSMPVSRALYGETFQHVTDVKPLVR